MEQLFCWSTIVELGSKPIGNPELCHNMMHLSSQGSLFKMLAESNDDTRCGRCFRCDRPGRVGTDAVDACGCSRAA
jgi:hypothetical protein